MVALSVPDSKVMLLSTRGGIQEQILPGRISSLGNFQNVFVLRLSEFKCSVMFA